MSLAIRKAFVLGAGLGTRLRPLTESLPKPLIPLWNRPLLSYAFDHLRADLGVETCIVNTHHCPEAYAETYPEGVHEGMSLAFRHEPTLLDTAGGLANVADWLLSDAGTFAVYNGDILTDLPLRPALKRHESERALVTMILRHGGALANVAYDPATGRVADLRDLLGAHASLPRLQFTGIYLVRPEFLRYVEPGRIESVVFPLLNAIRAGETIAGIVIDAGRWSDLGQRDDYLDASASLATETPPFPRYGRHGTQVRLHPGAKIDLAARIDALSAVGDGCAIGAGAEIVESILWPGASVAPGAKLSRCVVRPGRTVPAGEWRERDF